MRELIDERADPPRRIAARRFDLDNVGTHVGQQPPA
jgi:hypothetical protein